MNFVKSLFNQLPVVILLALISTPASATTNMFCTGIDSDADIAILFGGGPVLNALEAEVFFAGKAVSTRGRDDAENAVIAQFSADRRQLRLELINDQADQLLATIRLLRHLDDNGEPVQIGLLQFGNSKPVGITCEGP